MGETQTSTEVKKPVKTAEQKIADFSPQYTENPTGAKWQRWSVSFEHHERTIAGTGKSREEAAANAIANMMQNKK